MKRTAQPRIEALLMNEPKHLTDASRRTWPAVRLLGDGFGVDDVLVALAGRSPLERAEVRRIAQAMARNAAASRRNA